MILFSNFECHEKVTMSAVYYLPLLTFILSALFCIDLYRQWLKEPSKFFAWWIVGIFFYGAGTLPEAITAFVGWNENVFKAWYILGALIGGFPLAQGTIYLIMKKNPANFLSVLFIPVIIVGAIDCALSPIDYSLVETYRLSGKVLMAKEVSIFTIVLNTYSLLFFVGGTVYSAIGFWRNKVSPNKCYGNLLIAFGGLLPGIGGAFMHFEHNAVLYISEFLGIIFIYTGYRVFKMEKKKMPVSKEQIMIHHAN